MTIKSIISLLVMLCVANSFAISPQEIVSRADDARAPQGSFSFKVRVKDYLAKKLVQENVYRVHSKDMKYTLVETVFPERLAGRKLLMAGSLWLYLPTLKRPTRVGMQQRLTGEVANGDIARARFSDDYTPQFEKKEKLGGKTYFRMLLTARDKTAAYRKVRLWVAEKDFFPFKAEFYALSGKLLKTGEFSEPEMVMGRQRLTAMVIKDALQPTKQSHLKYFGYQKENLDEKFFNKESLGD